jgi:hypothetical protein
MAAPTLTMKDARPIARTERRQGQIATCPARRVKARRHTWLTADTG